MTQHDAFHDAFLQAILAEPQDNTHRLVYADWLEENGQEERMQLYAARAALGVGMFDGAAVEEEEEEEEEEDDSDVA